MPIRSVARVTRVWSTVFGLTLIGVALLAGVSPLVGAFLLDRRGLLSSRLALGSVATLLVVLGGITIMVLTPVVDGITCDIAAIDMLGDGFDGAYPPCLAATREHTGLGLLVAAVPTAFWWAAQARARRRVVEVTPL